ncbi:bifunctional apoptosis regulator [Patella vulgata]|uniref:bifunctional apoptosis regulator n=1 Tax=Patella vulgata TaxID=6465 RepID=UPI00217F2E23|nr:bifunctional apoptosis regulator [Patella vulgata]XP_050394717.1 bifunctional apoptosis regulator [Patella vulgata]XP_050394718.1 bifunctional apoptosis regulator [Patella vulgata]
MEDSDALAVDQNDDNRDEFQCSCCFNLMTQPTSLMCGHNFCRGCLARWYLSSKKRECPTCRQKWQGHPRVNITLRNMMTKMFKKEVEELETELDTNEDTKSKLDEFDRQLDSREDETDPRAFCTGIVLTLAAILVIYLAWFWRNSDQDLLIRKPLWSWKPKDVSQWLTELSWADKYSEFVLEEKIDGMTLMAFDEKSLQEKLHIDNPLHLKALLLAIHGMTDTGVKFPTNLWEYKSIYPGRSLFLLYGLKDFPRTTLLYLYLYKYEEVFLPFLHYTIPADDSIYISTEHKEPYSWQLITFIMYAVVLPYWLIGKFSWVYCDVNRWTSWFVMMSCFLLSYLEISVLKDFLQEQNKLSSLRDLFKKHFKMLVSISIFVVIWPVVPRLICDFFFYAALYFSPIQLAIQIKNNFLNLRAH